MSESGPRQPADAVLPGTFSLGRVGGVPLRVHWSVLIIMALIASGLATSAFPVQYPDRPVWTYVLAAVAASVVFLLALLAHEVSHALVARRNGVGTSSITLWLFGGVAQLGREADTPGAELRIAGVGPLVSLLLGLAFLGIGQGLAAVGVTGLVLGALSWLAWINILLAAFNVLPGAPLDGGRLLRAALWKWRGDRQWAAITAARFGRGLGLTFVALGLAEFLIFAQFTSLWLALIGWFIMGAASAEERSARLGVALAGVRVRDVMTPYPDTVPPDTSVAEFIDQYVFAHRHSTFPVTEHGRPVGLVTLGRVKSVSREDRPLVRLASIACPMDQVPTAAPDEPLADLIPRLQIAPDTRALVIDDGLLVGIVSPVDITRAIEHATLRAPAPSGGRAG